MWLKICGMTSEAAVEAALAAGVDAIGFVFAPSVRRLTPARAAELAAPARGRLECIAVTLHPQQVLVDEIMAVFKPDVLQTDIEDLAQLQLPQGLQRLPVMRQDVRTTLAPGVPPGAALPPRLLFEGPHSGSGRTSDWARATELAVAARLILAGGLNADNVTAAIRRVRPYGVDASSGVESAPGQKSPQMMMQFVSAARAAFHEIHT